MKILSMGEMPISHADNFPSHIGIVTREGWNLGNGLGIK
jgi:hypothetical protein